MLRVDQLNGFGVRPLVTAIAAVGGAALTSGEADAWAVDFTYHTDRTKQASLIDSGTPANNYDADPYTKLTYTSPSLKMCRQSDGVWRYGNHNTALRSQTFDNAFWAKSACSISADTTTAPDGTSTADTFIESATNADHYLNPNTGNYANFPRKVSLYVKAKDRTWIALGTDFANTWFDVGNGVLGTDNAGGAITSVGSGWYLCSITSTSSTTAYYFYITTGNNVTSYAGDGTSGIYIWGAQEKRSPVQETAIGSIPTGYLATAGAAKYDLPYEWNAALASQGILIEEQRTNLSPYSQTLDNDSWTKSGSTASANATTAPDGTTTADKQVENSGGTYHAALQDITISANTNYAISMFVKAAGRTVGQISWVKTDYSTGISTEFDLSGVTVSGSASGTGTLVSTSIADAGSGWYRVTLVGKVDASSTGGRIQLNLASGAGVYSYSGDGSSGMYQWGMQVEAGSFSTSPIHTIAATVTRAVDNITLLTSAFPYSATDSTVVASVYPFSKSTSPFRTVWSLDDTSVDNRSFFRIRDNASNPAIVASTALQSDLDGLATFTVNTAIKVATAIKANDVATSIGGGTVATDATVTVPSVTTLRFGTTATAGSEALGGYIRQITYLKRRATNGQLQTLTT